MWFSVAENCNTNNIDETLLQSLEQIYIQKTKWDELAM